MKKVSPYLIIVLSFLIILMIGACLLVLPISSYESTRLEFMDAFFISTSAVTITGLSPLANLSVVLTPFGKVVLAILVQIGGLSVVTISVFILYMMGAKIGIGNRVLIKETLNQNHLSGMVKMVKKIVIFTVVVEGIGFIINLFIFLPEQPFFKAVGLSLFHAISAFNNAGFDLLGDASLQAYSGHILLNLNTAMMIMIGGLGFIVVNDIIEKKRYKKFATHTKIVLMMSLTLWILGTFIFKFSESSQRSLTWLESFFLSVTARTAGFTTINMVSISSITTLVLLILMFIGAAPSSTGGGIKITTVYTLFKSASSYAKGTQAITHHRLITAETRQKASVLLSAAIGIVLVATILILWFEQTSLDKAMFEVISAFANVGLSKNLTPQLSNASKIVIAAVMFAGRVGPLTLLSLLNKNWYKQPLHHIEYMDAKMMIG